MAKFKLRFEDVCDYEVEANDENEALATNVPNENHRTSITVLKEKQLSHKGGEVSVDRIEYELICVSNDWSNLSHEKFIGRYGTDSIEKAQSNSIHAMLNKEG